MGSVGSNSQSLAGASFEKPAVHPNAIVRPNLSKQTTVTVMLLPLEQQMHWGVALPDEPVKQIGRLLCIAVTVL